MASTLYVGGLSYPTTSESFREYFAQCGTVESATLITDRFSGQSRRFGFVEMFHSGGGPGGHRKAQRSAIRGAQNSWATWRKGRGIAAVARVARPVGRAARSGGSRRVSPSRFRRRRLHRRVAGDAGGLRFMPGAREG